MFTVMVTGSQEWFERHVIYRDLDEQLAFHGDELRVIHGAAKRGADRFADIWCRRNQVAFQTFKPDYVRYGSPAAQHIRNQQMIDERPDLILAYLLNDSPGTASTIAKAHKAGLTPRITRATGEIVEAPPAVRTMPDLASFPEQQTRLFGED